ARASRNVSRTRAAVAKKVLSLIDRLHEHVFKSADGARHRLNRALLSAQKIYCAVGFVAGAEKKLDISIALRHGGGFRAQFPLYLLGHAFRLHAITAARDQILYFSLQRDFPTVDDRHLAAEELYFRQ